MAKAVLFGELSLWHKFSHSFLYADAINYYVAVKSPKNETGVWNLKEKSNKGINNSIRKIMYHLNS